MNHWLVWLIATAGLILFSLPYVNSDDFAKHGLFWSGASVLSTAISSQGIWEDVAGARLNLSLPSSKMMVLSYYLNVEGIRDINGLPLPREGINEFLQVRCKIDGIPYRISSAMTSNYDVEHKIQSKLSSIFSANLTAGNHQLILQWKRTGTRMKKWVTSSDYANPSFSIVAHADFENVAFLHELQDAYINVAEIWKPFTKNMTFSVPRESTVTISFTAVVQPQLLSFIKDRSMEYLTVRPVLDGVAYVDGAQTFGCNPWNPTATTIQGSLRLNVSAGEHKVALQWRKMGNAFRGWTSSPSFMDGFTTSRNIIVSVDKFISPAIQSHDRSIIKSADMNGWKAVGNNTIQLTLIKESAVVIRYGLPITQHSNPNLIANVWDPLAVLRARVVIDGIAYTQLGSLVGVGSRTFRDNMGQLAVVLPPGMHTISLQWQTSAGVSWTLLNDIAGGFAHGESLLTFISSEDSAPKIAAPVKLNGTKDTVLTITSISVGDIDDSLREGMYVKVTMSVQHGTLHFPNLPLVANDIDFIHLENKTEVILVDSIFNINAALYGMEYYPDYLFFGEDILHVKISDQGNVGYGPPKFDEVNVSLEISFVDYPFTLAVPEYLSFAMINESSLLHIDGVELRDVDSFESIFEVKMSVSCGKILVSAPEVFQKQLELKHGDIVDGTIVLSGKFHDVKEALKFLRYSSPVSCAGRMHPEVFRIQIVDVNNPSQTITRHTLIDVSRDKVPPQIRSIAFPRWSLLGVTPFSQVSKLITFDTKYNMSFAGYPNQVNQKPFEPFVPEAEAAMSEIVFFQTNEITYKLSVQYGILKAFIRGSPYIAVNRSRDLTFETSMAIGEEYIEAFVLLNGHYFPMERSDAHSVWKCSIFAEPTLFISSPSWMKLVFIDDSGIPLESNFMFLYPIQPIEIVYAAPSTLIQSARTRVEVTVSSSALVESCIFGNVSMIPWKRTSTEIVCESPLFSAYENANVSFEIAYAGDYKASGAFFHVEPNPTASMAVLTGDQGEGGWVMKMTGNWSREAIDSVRWVNAKLLNIRLSTQLQFVDDFDGLYFTLPLSDSEVIDICQMKLNWSVVLELDQYSTNSFPLHCANEFMASLLLKSTASISTNVITARVNLESIIIYGTLPSNDIDDTTCLIDNVRINPVLMGTNAISCGLPYDKNIFNVALLSAEGLTIYNQTIDRIALPRIVSLTTNHILSRHISTISFQLDRDLLWQNDSSLVCVFQNKETRAVQISSQVISCETPLLSAGNVSFGLRYGHIYLSNVESNNGLQQLEIISGPFVTDIVPNFGSVTGGDVITLFGGGFQFFEPNGIFCRFGNVLVEMTIESENVATCLSPNSLDAVVVEFGLESNVQVALKKLFTFDYLQAPQLLKATVLMSKGFSDRSVSLRGVNFRSSLPSFCRFENSSLRVRAIVYDDNHAVCSLPPEIVATEFSMWLIIGLSDDARFQSNTIVTVIASQWEVESIFPKVVFAGSRLLFIFRGKPISNETTSGDIHVRLSSKSCDECDIISETVFSCLCNVPHIEGLQAWDISLHGVEANIPSELSSVIVVIPPVIAKIQPRVSFLSGGEVAYLSGTGFWGLSELSPVVYCNFTQNHLSVATIFNDSVIGCIVAPSMKAEVGSVSLVVSSSLQIESDVSFRYVNTPSIWSVDKTTLSADGYEQLIILGSEFESALQYRCRFDQIHSTYAQVLSNTSLACITPQFQSAQEIILGVSVEDSSVISGAISIRAVTSSVVRIVSPTTVSSIGGTMVTLTGIFHTFSSYSCLFNNTVVAAVSVDNTTVICESPIFSKESLSSVEINLLENEKEVIFGAGVPTKLDLISPPMSSLIFGSLFESNATSLPAISSLSTTILDGRGGTIVRILFEEEIDSNMYFSCVFGSNLTVHAVHGGLRMLTCKSPVLFGTGECELKIVVVPTNQIVSQFKMRVLQEGTLKSLSSDIVLLGSENPLFVHGEGFSQTRKVACVFSNIAFAARVFSDGFLSCGIPPISGKFKIGISFDDTWFFPTQDIFLTVLPRPTFTNLFPKVVVLQKMARNNISVFGNDFSSLQKFGNLSCRLGNSISSDVVIVSNTDLVCRNFNQLQSGSHILHISYDKGFIVDTFINVTIIDNVEIFSIIPFTTLDNQSHVVVKMLGNHFSPSKDLNCVVGNVSTPALVMNSKTIFCSFYNPDWSIGSLEYGISYGESERVMADGVFEVRQSSIVSDFSPKKSSVIGGEVVTIYGEHFFEGNGYSCEFGMTVVNALVLSSTQLLCVTPKHGDGITSFQVLARLETIYSSDNFEFLPMNVITSIFPSALFSASFKNVTIHTKDDLLLDTYQCNVNNTAFVATKLDNRAVVCFIGPFSNPGPSLLYLSAIDGTRVTNALTFHILIPVIIEDTNTQVVTAASDSRVLLRGSNLPVGMKATCSFDLLTTTGVVVDGNLLACPTPDIVEGNSSALLTIDFSGAKAIMSPIRIQFIEQPVVYQLSETKLSSSGEIVWFIQGDFLTQDGLVTTCLIDNLLVRAVSVSVSGQNGIISCSFPSEFACPTVFKVKVASVEALFTESFALSCAQFPSIVSMTPSIIVENQDIEFSLTGENMDKFELLQCVLDDKSTNVTMVSSTLGKCNVSIPRCVRMANNLMKVYAGNRMLYSHYFDCSMKQEEVIAIQPSIVARGDKNFLLSIRGYFQSKQSYVCLIDDVVVATAVFVDNSLLQCMISSSLDIGKRLVNVESLQGESVGSMELEVLEKPVLVAAVSSVVDSRLLIQIDADIHTDVSLFCQINSILFPAAVFMSTGGSQIPKVICDISSKQIVFCQDPMLVASIVSHDGLIESSSLFVSIAEFCVVDKLSFEADMSLEPILANSTFLSKYAMTLTKRRDQSLDIDFSGSAFEYGKVFVSDRKMSLDRGIAYLGWYGIFSEQEQKLVVNSSRYLSSNNVSHFTGSPFQLDSTLQQGFLSISNVRSNIVDSINGSWIDVFGDHFVSHTVCVIGNKTELPTVYLSPSLIRCYVPPPPLFQPLSIVLLRVKNTLTHRESVSAITLWYDVAYESVFGVSQRTDVPAEEEMVMNFEFQKSRVISSPFVCLLKDGCSQIIDTELVSLSQGRSPLAGFKFPSLDSNFSLSYDNSSWNMKKVDYSAVVFSVEPKELSLPCDNCFVQVVGSGLKEISPLCMVVQNISSPCFNSINNEDSEIYCSFPPNVHPGYYNVSLSANCESIIYSYPMLIDLTDSGHKWSLSKEKNIERVTPMVTSIYPSFGWSRYPSKFDLLGEHLDLIVSIALVPINGDITNQVMLNIEGDSSRLSLKPKEVSSVLAGEYSLLLRTFSGETVEMSKSIVFFEPPILLTASSSYESPQLANVYGEGFGFYSQVLCQIIYPNQTTSLVHGKIFNGQLIECKKENGPLLGASFALSFNGLDFTDSVPFVDIPYNDMVKNRSHGKQDVLLYENHFSPNDFTVEDENAVLASYVPDPVIVTMSCSKSNFLPMRLFNEQTFSHTNFSCVLDSNLLGTSLYNSHKSAICKLPPLRPATYTVQLFDMNGRVAAIDTQVICTPEPKVSSVVVAPKFDNVKTTFIIRGVYFSEFMNLRCYIDKEHGEVSIVSQYKLLCIIPFLSARKMDTIADLAVLENDRPIYSIKFCVSSALLMDGGDLSLPSVEFGCKQDVAENRTETRPIIGYNFSIRSVFPRSGLTSGNTVVRIGLLGASLSMNLRCLFDDIAVPALVTDVDSIVCRSPVHIPGNVSLAVISSNDWVQWCCEAFTFYPPMMISHWEPTHLNGYVTSVVQMRVTNLMLDSSLYCHVHGIEVVPAMIVNSSHVFCRIPVLYVSQASVSLGSFEESWSNAIVLSVEHADVLMSIEPEFGSVRGGTTVTVQLPTNLDIQDPYCEFGEFGRVVGVLDDDRVHCISPYSHSVAIVDLYISDGPKEVDPKFYAGVYKYLPAATLHRVDPISYQIGRPIDLHLFGANFMDSSSLTCLVNGYELPAVWMSSSMVACQIPASQLSSNSMNATVEVSNNGLDVSEPIIIAAKPFFEIADVHPLKSFTNGGTNVYVSFTTDVSEETFVCIFDGVGTQAILVSGFHIVCNAPMHPAGNVSVEVVTHSFNRVGSFEFSYLPLPRLTVSEDSIFITNISSQAILSGENIPGDLTGRFRTIDGRLLKGDCYAQTAATMFCKDVIVDVSSGYVILEISIDDGGSYMSNAATVQVFSPVSVVWTDPMTVLNNGIDDLRFAVRFEEDQIPLLVCEFSSKERDVIQMIPATIVGKDMNAVCEVPPLSTMEENFFSVLQHKYRIFGPTHLTVLPSVVLESVDRSSVFIGLHQSLMLKFSDAIYPYPPPALEFQGHIYPLTILNPFRGMATINSIRLNTSETLYLTYPTQSNRKFPLVNLSVVDFAHDLNIVAQSLVVQTPFNITVESKSCALERDVSCQVSDGQVETVFVNSCRLECSILIPFMSSMSKNSTVLRLCRDDDCFVPLVSSRLAIMPSVTVLQTVPTIGTVLGKSLIRILGTGFTQDASLQCLFGNLSVDAFVQSERELHCILPPSHPGLVQVQVGRQGVIISKSIASFTYLPVIETRLVNPTTISSEGGTIVSVSVHKYLNGSLLHYCRFNDVLVRMVVLNSTDGLCEAPALHLDTAEFAVAISEYNDLTQPIVLRVQRPLNPIFLDPSVVVAGADGIINVFFEKAIPEDADIECFFGGSIASMNVYDDYVSCHHDATEPGMHTLTLFANGVPFYNMEVESRLPYRILSVWPQYAFTHHSTPLEIELSGSEYLESIASCCFGHFRVPASAIGFNRWQCFSPTIPDDGRNQSLTLPVGMVFGENFCDFSNLEVTLLPTLQFSSSSFHQGLIYGGDSVLLPMAMDIVLDVVYCRVGTQISPGQFLPMQGILCITPPSPRGLYPVEVSVNGIDFQLSGTSFEFLLPRTSSYIKDKDNTTSRVDASLVPVIYTLSMYSFPATGQFNVFVTGVNYNYESVCTLESGAILETVYFSPTMIQCFMPVRPAGKDKLIVTNQDSGISSIGESIEFVTSPTVSSLTGTVVSPSFGPRNRQTIITVSVPGLNGETGYSCLIGEQWVPSFNVTNNTLSCIAPINSYVGQVKVQVGNPDPVLLEGYGTFEYIDVPIAYDVQPKAATYGSTLLIFGRGFLKLPSVSMIIGSTESSCSIINDERLICEVPNVSANDYQIFLTTNGQFLIQTGLEYTQMAPVKLDSLWPLNGPALKGQTILSIYGSNFPETIDVFCLIDTAMVPATVISPSLAQCRVPPHTPAIVKVSLLADSIPLHPRSQSLDFAYVPDVSVVRITPNFGYTAGSFPILVFGNNFVNTSSLGCMFADMKTRGIFLSNTSLVCLLPSTLGRPELADQSNIPVEVTVNGYDYSDSKRMFTYSQPCDRGFFCPGLTRQLCPNGTYCPENSRNFTLCPPGTFQPMQGQTGCVLCAVGYLCPDQGMSRPLQCPNGLICDSMGMSATSKLCPAGSYCLNTTKSSSPDDFVGLTGWVLNNITGAVYFNENVYNYSYTNWPAPAVGKSRPQAPPESSCDGLVCQGGSGQILAEAPFPCPIGHYCRAGAGTQIPIPKNFSSPQRCYDGFFCPRGSYNPEGAGPCPNGFFCPTQLYAIICPAGTYCPGVGNTAPVECYPGTYNPFEGRANCTVCPAGYICPGWGLLLPEPCPAGFVCTSLGLSYPVVLCPAGYYCDEGTITLDPSDPSPLRPKICREGQFCLGGVSSKINIEWINTQPWGSTHPQTCAEGTYCQAGAYLSSGSGLCFQGHYCPPNTSFPIQTPLGNFASGLGSVAPTLCYPGTYAPLEAQVNCDKCPSGHTCTSYGAYIPAICPKGTYRSQVDSLTCVNCPVGTYSYETGAPDISMCLPCPQGAVCPVVQMTNFDQSGTCPNGYVCGAGTQLSNQFTHFSPAGYSTDYGTKPEDMYDQPCDSGFYCPRGTPLNQNTASKCTVGAFCPKATPVSPSRETLCPEYTTSPTATTQVSSCVIYPTPVCRKELVLESNPLESIRYYSSFSYDMLDESETTVELDSSLTVSSPTGEVQVVEIIHPLNYSSSTPSWVNDTIEAFRSCPPYGSGRGGDVITIIGRNFKDTQLNFCKFRACLSSNSGQHLRRCRNQINAPTGESLPIVGNISQATYVTKARFISPTRMECTTPEFLFNDDEHFNPTFAVNNYECMWLDAFGNIATKGNGNFSYVRPCDTVPGTVCINAPMAGYEFFSKLVFPCTVTESYLGICGDTPIKGYMMNPCMSGEVAVEVTNDGEHYSGGDELTGIFLVSTVRYYDGDVIYDNFKNYSINATLAVYTMVMPEFFYTNPDIMAMEIAHCSLPRYMEEAPRPREADIYMLKALEVALVRIDLSFLPDFMVYGQHYLISIYVRPSRCDSNFCNAAGVQLPPEEFVPCQSPISYSNWFNQKDIPKNVVNNITIFALDDLLFQIQIHIPYGLFAAYRPLFYNTTSVNIRSPSRAKSIIGMDKKNVATRELTPHVSFVRQTVPMQYIFCAVVYQDDSAFVYQPLNLPPRYADYAEGRALLMNNVSVGNPKVPLVLDNYDDINFGVDFWMMPATTPSESKEQLDAYFETFHETTYDATTGYTFDFQTLVLPYFPYFSNCYGFDSYIPIWYVTENPDMCTLPEIYDKAWPRYRFDPLPTQDQIRFVGPFDIFTDPIADWCQVTLQCNYEEQLTTTEATPRWFELESSETLFNLVRTPLDYYQYTGREGITVSRNDGGGGAYVQELAAITTDNFIPVTIVRTTASTGCTLQCFPRAFKLEIQYYQFDAHNKRIIAAMLEESSFDRNTERTDYELTINFRPLGFIDLILAFAFDTSIFVVLFILIGFMTVFVAFIGWLITRVTTLLQNPPQLRLTGMLALIVPPPMAGVTMAVTMIWLMTALANNFIYGVFVTDPNSPLQTAANAQYIDQYPLLYNNLLTGTLTEDQILSARMGRIGTAFMMIAFCCFAVAAKMYFPKEETKRELEIAQKRTPLAKKRDLWQPMLWKKLNFVFASFILGTFLVCAVYLSYWTDYDTYFYQVFVMYILLGEFVAYVAQRQLQDEILIAPLKCAYGFQAGLISFGSPNFLDFILSNYVEFAITSFQRVFQKFYLDGLSTFFHAASERGMQLLIRIVPKYLQGYSLFRQTEEAEKDYRKRAVEGIALQDEENESVEPILEYFGDVCCDTVITWYSPYVVYLLMQYRIPIYIPVAYGIRQSDMVIYMVYQLFLIVFQPLVDIFNHSQNELFYGWKIYEYLVYSRYRFLQRETRWKGMENSLDECIEESLRRLDQMCFSSQYFLMLTVQFNGIIYVMLAYQIWIQNQYSPFSDPAVFFLGGYIFALFLLLRHGVLWLAIQLKVWRIKHENTAWHIVQEEEDELDIPAWEEIKGASTEAFLLNQRITSETFRYKFLNYNRTWLINQLPQILTPRTLRRSRPYLINQFERIINAKRDDISDDSEGEEKKFGPVALTAPSRNIIRWWLGRAKRRMRLRNFVEPLIKRARGAQCEQCLSRKQLQVEYEVDLDTMSNMYDKSYPGDEEVDQVQWKTFWTNNQRYHTICLACITKRKEVEAKKALQAAGAGGTYDPLYDDDEQEAYPEWGPVFLSAASKAIMLNWYKKAQKLRAGKRKQRVRKDKVVKDISDDEGDEPAFSWLKDGLKDITPASKAIAIKWMRTARARLQQKRGKGAGLREKDVLGGDGGGDGGLGEGFRSGNKSKMLRK